MAAKNHPYFFPLLKKLLIVSLRGYNTDKISVADREEIARESSVGIDYCTTIFRGGVYHKSAISSVGKKTLDKLVGLLSSDLGYDSWDTFCFQEQQKMQDDRLLYDISSNSDYADSKNKNHRERIRKEIEYRAEVYIQELLRTSKEEDVEDTPVAPDESELNPMVVSVQEPIEEPVLPQSSETTNTPSSSKPSNKQRVIVGLVLIGVFLGVYFWGRQPNKGKQAFTKKSSHQTVTDTNAILRTVYRSIALEMNAYRHVDLHEAYADSLAQVFYPEAMARIIRVIKRSYENGHTLMNTGNPSHAEPIRVLLDRIDDNGIAYIKTFERWLIMWYDLATQDYVYTYDVAGPQTYKVGQDSLGVWKIITNAYSGNAPKSIPKKYKYADIADQIEVPFEVFEEQVMEDITMGNIEKAMAMIQFWLRYKYPKTFKVSPVYLEIMQIEARFRTAQKHLNLKKATAKSFEASKEEAIKKTYQLLITLEQNHE